MRFEKGILKFSGSMSPCSIEVRTDYFIYKFDQQSMDTPTNFALLNGKRLDFQINYLNEIDAYSRDFRTNMESFTKNISNVDRSHRFQIHSERAEEWCFDF